MKISEFGILVIHSPRHTHGALNFRPVSEYICSADSKTCVSFLQISSNFRYTGHTICNSTLAGLKT